jgi:adenylate cyclase
MRTFGISGAKWRGTLLSGGLTLLAVFALQIAGFTPLTRVGQLIFDSYVRAKPRPYEAAPVRIVDIDEESLRRYGQWPWPRTDIALLIQRLGDAGAEVIANDLDFSEDDRT